MKYGKNSLIYDLREINSDLIKMYSLCFFKNHTNIRNLLNTIILFKIKRNIYKL